MSFNFTGNVMKNIGTVADVPSNCDIDFNFNNNQLEQVRKVLNIRDSYIDLLIRLNLKQDTPREVFEEAILTMKSSPNNSEEERVNVITKSRLNEYLEAGANISTIAAFIFEMCSKL